MKCNGKTLSENQISMLHFMINNYYKKNMDVCSCDVERVLGRNEMGLTKLESAIVVGAFVQSLGDECLENSEDNHQLEQLVGEIEKVVDNSTPKQMREAGAKVLDKFIHNLFEG
ncbi:hypothetical protein [Bacillus paranthracis]|uniref:hypothetical protein n=1 Tax=Bacillus paranthracis TaxID=2026186 RepID=UPI001E42565A|nr:hypothetical protein [Bacillus paranthracis]MCC2442052.1 hypothetical protein [Bacillus paranthracis]